MTQERVNALEQVGFVWDSHGAAWETRFSELCDYLRQHGHTNVPSKHHNKQLSTWVKCQRRQYKMRFEVASADTEQKKTLLSEERIQRLEAIGFEWELRSRSKRSS